MTARKWKVFAHCKNIRRGLRVRMSEFHGCSNSKGLDHGKNTLKWFFEFEVSVDYDYSKDEGIAHDKNTLMILYDSKCR